MTDCSGNIFIGRNGFLEPQNSTKDTKIITLGGLVWDMGRTQCRQTCWQPSWIWNDRLLWKCLCWQKWIPWPSKPHPRHQNHSPTKHSYWDIVSDWSPWWSWRPSWISLILTGSEAFIWMFLINMNSKHKNEDKFSSSENTYRTPWTVVLYIIYKFLENCDLCKLVICKLANLHIGLNNWNTHFFGFLLMWISCLYV